VNCLPSKEYLAKLLSKVKPDHHFIIRQNNPDDEMMEIPQE
jgi:hypothetical protein